MQTIYADVFFFINMFVDYSLLLCVKRIIHSNTKYNRLLTGAFSGAVFSFTAFLPFNHFPINFLLDTAIAAVMTLLTFGYKNKIRFLKTCSVMIVVSFLFTGAMIFFYNAIHPNGMVIINNAVYFNISPVLLIILTLVIYIVLYVFKKLFKNHASSNLVHNLRVYISDKEYKIKSKTDSGCNVKEPFSGDKVIIIEKNVVDCLNNKKMRLIPFNSLGGTGILEGYKADKVYIDDKFINEEVYIGLCEGLFKAEIKGLIPENLIED